MPGDEINVDFDVHDIDEEQLAAARRTVCRRAIEATEDKDEQRADASRLLAMLGLIDSATGNGACSGCKRRFSSTGRLGTVKRKRDGRCANCYDQRHADVVETGDAQDHIAVLRAAGMRLREIADAATISLGVLFAVRTNGHANADVVARIMAIPVPDSDAA
ncbi:hypothetical protein [Nocardia sp. NBC_01009]|uniref:hypothetical protein n=1 Tax=Nocardia sp. NBC_01009 TaxID=2975996 RepID=UPI0038678C87|nr:hypothetical protein OHA42_05070 [Nocardia sp. NBC_01009]